MDSFFELLPNLLNKLISMDHPNNNPVMSSDVLIGILTDELARKLWTLKQGYRKDSIIAFLDDKKIVSSIIKMRHDVCKVLFLNRVAEVMGLFEKKNIVMRSNWEIAIDLSPD